MRGTIPPRMKEIMHTAYMLALHKDGINKHKLQPLGIPSGIRSITAAATEVR